MADKAGPASEPQVLPYAPQVAPITNKVTITNGDTHTIGFTSFTANDLVILLPLQRGHGPGSTGWNRAKRLYERWDGGKVLTIDVVKITLAQDTEVLRYNGIDVVLEVLPKGTVAYHTMDGGHRLSAVWYSLLDGTEEPIESEATRAEVQGTVFPGNVYEWPNITSLDVVISKYFVAKNSERAAVSSSDKLKMRVNTGDPNAIAIEQIIGRANLKLPYQIDTLKAQGEALEVKRLTRDSRIVGAVGAMEKAYNYFGSGGTDFRSSPATDVARTHARNGLYSVLLVADSLYPAHEFNAVRGLRASTRWQGDWIMGLARILHANPTFAERVLDPATSGSILRRAWDKSEFGGRYGPEGWKARSSVLAGEAGRTAGSNEVIRSYYIGLAFVEAYNTQLKKNRLTQIAPLRNIPHEVDFGYEPDEESA